MLGLVSVAAGMFLAGDLKGYASVVVETRAGEAPLQFGGAPREGVVGVVTPKGELEYRESNLNLRLDYGPRVFYRQPNELNNDKPLVLHVANLVATTRATPTTTVTGQAAFSYGQVDYTSLTGALGGQQNTSAQQPTLPPDLLTATARVNALINLTRIWSLGLGLDVEHRRSVGSLPAPMDPTQPIIVLPTQTTVRAEPTAAARLSARDDLLLASSVAYSNIAGAQSPDGSNTGTVSFLVVTPEVGWRARMSGHSTFSVLGGVAYLRSSGLVGSSMSLASGGGSVQVSSPRPVSPVGSVGFDGTAIWARDLVLRTGLVAAAEYFVDPILQQAQPRATLLDRTALAFGPDWTAGLEASFAVSLTATDPTGPSIGGSTPLAVDTTVAAVSLPVVHRVSQNLFVEVGGRWADRGPNLWASGFAFHQRQLWLYVSLTATTRDVPRQPVQ